MCDFLVQILNFITIDGAIKTLELTAAFCGCFIAWKGLSTWRNQLIEEPKIKLATEIVEQFYNIRDLITYIRRSCICFSQQEIKDFFENQNLTHQQCTFLYREMELEKHFDEILKFQKLQNKAKILYSREIEDCFFAINKIIREFQEACIEMSNECKRTEHEQLYDRKQRQSFLNKIYIHKGKDETTLNINAVIKEVEYNLKPLYETRTIKWKKLKH